MTSAAHYFKAGARLARSSDLTRRQVIAWTKLNCLGPRATAQVLRGFDAELSLCIKQDSWFRWRRPYGVA